MIDGEIERLLVRTAAVGRGLLGRHVRTTSNLTLLLGIFGVGLDRLLVIQEPRLFAAMAPVCGAGSVPVVDLAGVPVWAFHGANDIVVPVRVTDSMVQKLQQQRE